MGNLYEEPKGFFLFLSSFLRNEMQGFSLIK